ncbi:phosphoribosylanthranilate isomerase [Weeksellaceae bacterium TAE3-ERU29]|nr:phosphoribosylanthranilate isomerase [Weeksellaceae bacterium TAE3-ERU29]
MQLKVCGLTNLSQIQEIIDLNTDFLGFIFYPKSPRYVLNHLELNEISEINHSGKVGVFVNESTEKITEITEKANLNYIQLHGDENLAFIEELHQKLNSKAKIIKVIRVGEELPCLDEWQKSQAIDYLLFDTDSKHFGGTGKTFDWEILNQLKIEKPYFLSGGISNENINEIQILKQKPTALDINSKFEISAGNKDVKKIKEFKERMDNILK